MGQEPVLQDLDSGDASLDALTPHKSLGDMLRGKRARSIRSKDIHTVAALAIGDAGAALSFGDVVRIMTGDRQGQEAVVKGIGQNHNGFSQLVTFIMTTGDDVGAQFDYMQDEVVKTGVALPAHEIDELIRRRAKICAHNSAVRLPRLSKPAPGSSEDTAEFYQYEQACSRLWEYGSIRACFLGEVDADVPREPWKQKLQSLRVKRDIGIIAAARHRSDALTYPTTPRSRKTCRATARSSKPIPGWSERRAETN
jgi:hypothetical protein